jgi:hypothetical protein
VETVDGVGHPPSPLATAGRRAPAEDVFPTVSGTRSLREDTHVLLLVEVIRPGHVTVCQFSDQRQPKLPCGSKFDDPAECLARIGKRLALVIRDVERLFAPGRFGKPHRVSLAVVLTLGTVIRTTLSDSAVPDRPVCRHAVQGSDVIDLGL